MSFVTVSDGTQIYYKDWGSGPPVLLSHGWPLNSDSWEAQMLFLATNGFRVIAHDRRGHGRSTQSWSGNDMDTYADDLATVIETLDLRDVALVGFSTGGGEVARYIGRHGTGRVAKVVLVSAVPPFMLRTEDNPAGVPIDGLRQSPGGIVGGPLADLSGPGRRTVLRRQPEGCEPVTRSAGRLLATGDAGRPPQRPGMHHRLLRHRLPAGSRKDRCPDPRHPRRRRPGRATRGGRRGIRGPDLRRGTEGLSGRPARHHRHPQGGTLGRPLDLSEGLVNASQVSGGSS